MKNQHEVHLAKFSNVLKALADIQEMYAQKQVQSVYMQVTVYTKEENETNVVDSEFPDDDLPF